MKIKICGITRKSDAILCESVGVDFLGFNFFTFSKRFIQPENAREIIGSLKKAKPVGVFVEPDIDYIRSVVERCNLMGIQIHGSESTSFCNELKKMFPGFIIIQAIRIKDKLPDNLSSFKCDYFLFDSFSTNMPGGTGKTFNWEILELIKPLAHKSFIAGGITLENIDKLLSVITPFGIDVATGVEKSPGVKDPEKIKKMVEKVKGKAE
ncbi:MAG: phosphoribosylanthranilate isomerase [Candidatus Omnitrophica bacterium]|nr:phosphoribosylanthranilate isomerase [Candidatus Omnitrophota bacterium]